MGEEAKEGILGISFDPWWGSAVASPVNTSSVFAGVSGVGSAGVTGSAIASASAPFTVAVEPADSSPKGVAVLNTEADSTGLWRTTSVE